MKNSPNTQLLSVLLTGDQGCGKTAFASQLAIESEYLYIKMISPEMFVGQHDMQKVHAIVKIFEDAYKSNLSLIILDDIERLIEFVPIGARFNNLLLQTLLILIKKKPSNPERKMMVLGTTSARDDMRSFDIVQAFNFQVELPQIRSVKEVTNILNEFNVSSEDISVIASGVQAKLDSASETLGIPVKKFLLALELAQE